MSTHVPGFQSFFKEYFLHIFVLAKLATTSIRVNSFALDKSSLSIGRANIGC